MQKLGGNSTSTFCFFMFFLFLLLTLSLFETSTGEKLPVPVYYGTREELSRVAGYGEEILSSVLVTGSIVCDACLNGGSDFSTSYVAGAKVSVACKGEWGKRRTTWVPGTTDEYGDFIIDLPSQLHGIPKLEAACKLKIMQLPKSSTCHGIHHINMMTPKGIRLSSVGNSIRVYTTGVIRLEKQSKVFSNKCVRKGDDDIEIMW